MTKLLNFLFLTVILSTQSTLSKPQNRFSGITDDEDDVASSGNGNYNDYDEYSGNGENSEDAGGVSGDYEYGESKATTQVPVTSTKNMKITKDLQIRKFPFLLFGPAEPGPCTGSQALEQSRAIVSPATRRSHTLLPPLGLPSHPNSTSPETDE